MRENHAPGRNAVMRPTGNESTDGDLLRSLESLLSLSNARARGNALLGPTENACIMPSCHDNS